jgi:glycogen debranching enzyme
VPSETEPADRPRPEDDYFLAAALRRSRIFLNHGDSFAIFDAAGDIPLAGRHVYGLFHRGTRHLDRLEVRLDGELPLLLSSSLNDDDCELVTHLCNADERRDGTSVIERDTVAISRSRTVACGTLHEQLQLHNYGGTTVDARLDILFSADFSDIFELRGLVRSKKGTLHEPLVDGSQVTLRYDGLDGTERRTVLVFSPAPPHLTGKQASYHIELPPRGDAVVELSVACSGETPAPACTTYRDALVKVADERRTWRGEFPDLYSNNESFNDLLNRSVRDIALLRAAGPWGSYVYAGIPWFATLFGRDGLITALSTLAFAPALAAATLRALAALQGTEEDVAREEEAGKIIHEMRFGELAATGEIPFARYYGSIDSTPLFLVLLAAYFDRTADSGLVRDLWGAALAAMTWIEEHGDLDGDGFVEYARKTDRGLINQGWKDSHDAISHEDGSLAETPIAVAEVQAYVYAAYRGMARVARHLKQDADAERWESCAAELRAHFNQVFWLADKDTFALALDRYKKPCRVVSSNAAHCLFGGIADPDKAAAVARRLMREDMFSGWGIRTLSMEEQRYNPMSYHNGSIWPHDTAIAAAGFARYGMGEDAGRLLTSLFEASLTSDDHRLPELFCGFPRRAQHQPVPYPVACRPQAWAAASVFLLLQAALGLAVEANELQVTFHHTCLPSWLERVDIRGLAVGDSTIDLCVSRGRWGAAVEVLDKRGQVDVIVRK